MSRNVFANGLEISCDKDDNKSTCAMPDVCLSPPSPPAGPVPIPYPNTSEAGDTSDGSKTVNIGGAEVGMKNSSNYKKSTGDEAATKSLGMGVVTHNIQGKMKHTAWSMDVKIEGANAIRHMDMTTHNHMNCPNIALTLNKARGALAVQKPLTCEELENANTAARANHQRRSGLWRPSTTTTSSYSPPGGGPGTFMAAMTRQDLIRSGSRNGFARSRPPDQTIACTDQQYGSGGPNNHTEPKLIENVFWAAGNPTSPGAPGSLGTLTMNIHHQPQPPEAADCEPCGSCRKAICIAVACGLAIKLCENGQERDAPCKDGEWTED